MEVLVYLVSRPQEVISREDLERDIWRGALVTDDAITATIIKLRKALDDNARQPRIIATVPKRGYKLIAPVLPLPEAENRPTGSEPWNHRAGYRVAAGAFAGVALLFIGWLVSSALSPKSISPNDDQPSPANEKRQVSVAVLPLKNISGDSRQEYLSDGIADDISTALSQIASLRVIARQSAERYRNVPVNLQEISRDLGVSFIVEGSVQKSGNKIRIIAELIDVGRNQLVWSERFDRSVNDLFAIQDEIAKRVADRLLITLGESDNRYVAYRPTNSFDAYDSFLQGQQHSRNRSREGYELTQEAYRTALEFDPMFGRVYGAMAVEMTRGYRMHWSDLSYQEARERSMVLARKAAALDKTTPQVYWALSYVHLFRGEYREAEEAARQSITLSPSYADGYAMLGFIDNWRGKAKEAEQYLFKAINLNPANHTFEYPWNLGFSYYTQGRYDEAARLLEKAVQINEDAYFPRLFLAASYVRLGRLEDASWEVERINIQRPGTTISILAGTLPFEHKSQLDSLFADLAKAGLGR